MSGTQYLDVAQCLCSVARSTTKEMTIRLIVRKCIREMLRVLAAPALFASTIILNVATSTSAQSYPVCLVGAEDSALRCDYTSLNQCRATASGGLGYCVMNPAYSTSAHLMSAVDEIGGRFAISAKAQLPESAARAC